MTTNLSVGEPAPWFSAASAGNLADIIAFDELAGRYIVLFFFGTAARPEVAQTLTALARRKDLFDGKRALIVGISNDREDFREGRLPGAPGLLFLLDTNGMAAKQYRLVNPNEVIVAAAISPIAFILSPGLQIIDIVPLAKPAAFNLLIATCLGALLARQPTAQSAPVLILPHVFDLAFCQRLIELFKAAGGREIGLIERDGKIVERTDPGHRKRLDYYISDAETLQVTRNLLERRLLPIVYRTFQFSATRIERYLVGHYAAQTGGYFRPHRDNCAPLVAHRRFALTIGLNDEYEGGYLSFPEFGNYAFRPSPGEAIVFSCSLLHEVTPVTHGDRYAFITFLYDEQSQRLRDENSKRVSCVGTEPRSPS